MKVLFVNTVCGQGSTGNIVVGLLSLLKTKGHSGKVAFGFGGANKVCHDEGYKIVTQKEYYTHNIWTRITDREGLFSNKQTKRFLDEIVKFNPDIVHLHNLHGHYINYELLFAFLKKINKPVVWTFHDCWSFTGHCAHFATVGCDKWKTKCTGCVQTRQYPTCNTVIGNAAGNYAKKKAAFNGVENLTIVTPSRWLGDLVKQSFLKDYPVQVINNGIDLSVFKPKESDFRKKYNCEDKFILLGVAFDWGIRKGLDVFTELAKRLDNKYQIVLVGTNDKIDKQLPDNIISIHRTHDQAELAEIYSDVDLFVNPTREENYPTVNMEAVACGTPVLTFCTGGSPEILDDTCGSVVSCDDIDALEREIHRIAEERPFTKADCLKRAQHFDMNARFGEYIELYKRVLENGQ